MSAALKQSIIADERHVLTDYQDEAVSRLTDAIAYTLRQQNSVPSERSALAKRAGVSLLQAPTASGKTLMLGRTLERLVSKPGCKIVWFWFTPYTGLVDQARSALTEQCPGLRLRDPKSDREPSAARSGDVFISTWGSVAAKSKDARRIRRTTEDSFALDDMIEILRLKGKSIGVVIDEAHLNFGGGAARAAEFYLNVLRPDITVLATATPKDSKLEKFAKDTGVEIGNRVVIGRDRVVLRGLNKVGLMLGTMQLRERDQGLVDSDTAALSFGWRKHCEIKAKLAEKGIGVTPLMLVQVENGPDAAQEAKQRLRSLGVPEDVIAIHTSKEPDAEFHTLAFDPSREILIFKVAVATGFDAPRAWTLVSLRRSRDKDFGLQIVGRIMRVHPAVRPYHKQIDLLDRGYVFLSDPDLQVGLDEAADALDAVKSDISTVTDELSLIELGTVRESPLAFTPRTRVLPDAPMSDLDRQTRLDILIEQARVPVEVRDKNSDEQDYAIQVAEMFRDNPGLDLFNGTLPEHNSPDMFQPNPSPSRGRIKRYSLRDGLIMPSHLLIEHPPEADVVNSAEFNDAIARVFVERSDILNKINTRMGAASVNFRDLFDEYETEEVENVQVRLDDSLIAKKGQAVFEFNKRLDNRLVRRSLMDLLRKKVVEKGYEVEDLDIRRAIFLAVMREPKVFKKVIKEVQASFMQVKPAQAPIPDFTYDAEAPITSARNIYGIVPADLNGPETAFAQWLDGDHATNVEWWLRNEDRKPWACNLFLPSGARFFPDFVVKVRGRSNEESLALVEVKGAHIMNSDDSYEKIQKTHKVYLRVLWVQRDGDTFKKIRFDRSANRVLQGEKLDILDLMQTT